MKMKFCIAGLVLAFAGNAFAAICDSYDNGGLGNVQFSSATIQKFRTDPTGKRIWKNIVGKTYGLELYYDPMGPSVTQTIGVGKQTFQYNSAWAYDLANQQKVAKLTFQTSGPGNGVAANTTCVPVTEQ